jgi:threonine dehydratase
VSEAHIMDAMRWLHRQHGWVGEGGGVVGIAAVMSGAVVIDRPTVIVVSGGNVDHDVLARVLR